MPELFHRNSGLLHSDRAAFRPCRLPGGANRLPRPRCRDERCPLTTVAALFGIAVLTPVRDRKTLCATPDARLSRGKTGVQLHVLAAFDRDDGRARTPPQRIGKERLVLNPRNPLIPIARDTASRPGAALVCH